MFYICDEQNKTMDYQIKRECWNEKTFNGYEDNPYWRIGFSWYEIGLSDDGNNWLIGNKTHDVKKNELVKEQLTKIVKECKLKIKLK